MSSSTSKYGRYSLYLAALMALTALGQGQARSLADIKSSKSLIVGISGNIPPFQYRISSTTPAVGFEIDVMKAIASDLGVDVVFKVIPSVDDLTKAVQADQVDAAVSTFVTTSTREKKADMSLPYACLATSIVTTDPTIKTQFDLKGKKVGVVKDTVFDSYLQKLPFSKQINILEYTTREEQASDFLSKKMDATLGWKAMNPFLAKVTGANLQDTPVLWNIPVGIMMHSNNASLRAAVNQSIGKMQKDGRFTKLDQQYFPKESVNCGP